MRARKANGKSKQKKYSPPKTMFTIEQGKRIKDKDKLSEGLEHKATSPKKER